MEKRTENRLLFGWFASSLKLLFFCFVDSVIDSASPRQPTCWLGLGQCCSILLESFFFMSFTTEWKLELIFHGLVVLHSYSVPAEFMHFANNIYSPFSFSTPGLYGILVFMLLALPHICLTLIRSDQLAKLEYKKAFCRWGPVVISNWCIVWEPNPICPLAVGPAAPYPPHRGRFFSLGIIDSLAW